MKNKKVGIVTFHTALNYGAILQTYALQKFLNNNNIDNEIIDYDCPFIKKCYSPFFIAGKKVINSLVRGVVFRNKIFKKRENFNSFLQKYINLSPNYQNVDEMRKDANKYKYFISGSDQVWSPISANFDLFYFLPFAEDYQKHSYAASLGTSKLTTDEQNALRQRLKGFKSISVREESAKELLKTITNINNIEVHIDPTLLLSKNDWQDMVDKKKTNEKYLLIFNVEKPINDIKFAKNIAKEKKLKIIYINDRTLIKDKKIKYVEAPTPNEFINLFANADTIITNSFHGTVFSIIFEKEFYVELENKKARNIRSESLLKKLNIQNREIKNIELFKPEPINWQNVANILEEERKKSQNYILKINESSEQRGED